MSFCNKEYGYLAYRAILFFSELNKRVECVRKCENMSINAINAVNVNYQPQKIENKKDVSNPVDTAPKMPTTQAGVALKAYFLGGQAVSFKGKPCSTGDFEPKKLDDVPCCCCGDRMIRGVEMPNVVDSFAQLKGNALADKIEKDKDYFRANQRVVASLIADEARKDDALDVAGALEKVKSNLPEKVQNYCKNVLNNVNKAAIEAYGDDKNPMSAAVFEEMERVSKGKMARIPFTAKLEAAKGDLTKGQYEKVLDAAREMPEGFNAVSKIVNKTKGGNSSEAIMRRLLQGALSTAEHVHPHSLGGPNNTANYLAECALCNNPRGSMSYAEWLKVHPEYPIKVQHHIEYIEQQIVDGKISSDYDDYPIDIRETMTKESNGAIVLKVLNPEKIQELREQKMAGKEVNVSEVTKEIYGDDSEENAAA